MASLTFDKSDLAPLIEQVAETVLLKLEQQFGNRYAFSEREAAKLLGISHTQLGDERRNGRIEFKIVGKTRIRYSRKHIIDYMNR